MSTFTSSRSTCVLGRKTMAGHETNVGYKENAINFKCFPLFLPSCFCGQAEHYEDDVEEQKTKTRQSPLSSHI